MMTPAILALLAEVGDIAAKALTEWLKERPAPKFSDFPDLDVHIEDLVVISRPGQNRAIGRVYRLHSAHEVDVVLVDGGEELRRLLRGATPGWWPV